MKLENNFVTYELALKAKEKGFNEPCFKVYDNQSFLQEEKVMDELKLEKTPAPTHQQVIDWLRETHKIHVAASSFPVYNNKYGIQYSRTVLSSGWQPESNTYNEARNRAIEEGLKLVNYKK